MTGDALVQQVGDRPKVSWWQVLRLVLVLGWVAWAGLAWWTAPREASVARARADIAADRLTYYEWGDGWADEGGLASPLSTSLKRSGSDGPGPMLLWRTENGRQHYTSVDVPAPGENTLLDGPEANALDAELRAYDSRRSSHDLLVTTTLAGLGIAGFVLFLWALVSAPDPATGTKWFWFWLITTVPIGLGLLWWLARERPWSPRAQGREHRLKWWAGIGIGIGAGLAVSVALLALRKVLGETLVPIFH